MKSDKANAAILPEYLYHYCSNASLLAILESRKIRLSDLTLSNDSLEGQWVREVLKRMKADGAAAHPWIGQAEELVDSVQLRALGFCLSENGDLLSQWRGYADQGAGCCVGFRTKELRTICDDFNRRMSKVEYDFGTQRERLDAMFSSLQPQSSVPNLFPTSQTDDIARALEQFPTFTKLKAIVSAIQVLFEFKNPAFSEEREWRVAQFANPAISLGKKQFGEMSEAFSADTKFRATGNKLVPYLDVEIPASAIGIVCIGPKNETPAEVMKAVVTSHGMSHVDIMRSTASFR